jgi:hypothetical protein
VSLQRGLQTSDQIIRPGRKTPGRLDRDRIDASREEMRPQKKERVGHEQVEVRRGQTSRFQRPEVVIAWIETIGWRRVNRSKERIAVSRLPSRFIVAALIEERQRS